MAETRTRRRRWPWIVAAFAVLVIAAVGILVVPILTHQNQGDANQEQSSDQWPMSATAVGDDGRTRELSVATESGTALDTSALSIAERLVVSGTGYDGSRGIYVAVCVIPNDPGVKPGPCIGGVPEQEQTEVAAGTIQFAPSNWINDNWAWKLFGARSYDDLAAGTFTAYLEVGDPTGEGFDCTVDKCAIFTRNDHTALNDRVQDVYIPVGFG